MTTPRQELTVEFVEQLQARARELRDNPPPHAHATREVLEMIYDLKPRDVNAWPRRFKRDGSVK